MNFSIAIPTYNREKDLEECLNSILEQTVLPSEILIVDDGELAIDFINLFKNKAEQKNIIFNYYKKNHLVEKRGLAESKNIIFRIASSEIFFILDDDLILDKNFFENIMKTWEKSDNKNLIGVGGIIVNSRKKIFLEKIYENFFGLNSKFIWDINDVGFQVWNDKISKETKGFYSHGGVCSYKKTLVNKVGDFYTFQGGRTALEDVEFCLRAKKMGYYFIINPEAKVIHKQSKISREKEIEIGFKESFNRRIIFQKHCKKSLKNYLWFYWANIGWILKQFLAGHFNRGIGMIKGLFSPIE